MRFAICKPNCKRWDRRHIGIGWLRFRRRITRDWEWLGMWWRVWMSPAFESDVDHALPQTSAVEPNPGKPNSHDEDQPDDSEAEEDCFDGPRTHFTKDDAGCHSQDSSRADQGNIYYDTHSGLAFL
jgi:hypothetical protein